MKKTTKRRQNTVSRKKKSLRGGANRNAKLTKSLYEEPVYAGQPVYEEIPEESEYETIPDKKNNTLDLPISSQPPNLKRTGAFRSRSPKNEGLYAQINSTSRVQRMTPSVYEEPITPIQNLESQLNILTNNMKTLETRVGQLEFEKLANSSNV